MRRSRLLFTIVLALMADVSVAFTVERAWSKTSPGIRQDSGRTVALAFDVLQCQDLQVPVCTIRMISAPGEPDEKGRRPVVIKEVLVENRSTKAVSSLVFRATITPAIDRTIVLKRVEFEPVMKLVHKTLPPGEQETLEFSKVMIFDLIQDIPSEKNPSNNFAIVVGVSQEVFADGSSWKEQTTEHTLPLGTRP